MKVLLIKPYWRVVRFVISPPIGILSLAAYLRERMKPTPEIIVIDQSASQVSLSHIKRTMEKERPDVVGITALTYEAPAVKILSDAVKEVLPGVPVVVGGPHATVFYDRLLEKTKTDIAVIGEGEETFLDLVERIRDGKDWKDAQGIAFRNEEGKIIRNQPRPPIMDLDSLPYPAWDMIDIPIYTRYGDMNDYLMAWPYMFLFSSRACPYACYYCHQIFGKKYRARSVESTLEEIRRLTRDHGVKEIHIIDDIFNIDLDRAKNICRGIIREGIKVSIAFPNGLRGDLLDAELIELLAKAGCYSITFAVETASSRLQKKIHKYADLDKLNWAISKAYDEGIIPMGFYMLGFPTETREEMEETIRFACRSKMLKAVFFSVVPFPRTKLYELFREAYPEEFNMSEGDMESMHYFPADSFYYKVTGIDLSAVVRSAYRRFYLSPSRLAKIFLRFRWNRRFARGIYHGLRGLWQGGHRIEEAWSQMRRRQTGMVDKESES